MKKALIFLMGILAAAAALMFVLNEQFEDNTYMDALGMPNSRIRIAIPDVPYERLVPELRQLSNKYDCSFIREDNIDSNGKSVLYRSGIFSANYWEISHFPLVSGSLPAKENEFLATWNTKEPNQTGIIRDRFHDMPLVFQNLETSSVPEGGGTWIVSSSYEDQDKVLNELAQWLNIPAGQIKDVGWMKTYSSGPVKLFLAGIVLLLMVFGAVCLFYPFNQSRTISIQALMGWKQWDIWWSLMGSILGIGGLFCLMAWLIPVLLYRLDFEMMFKLLLVEGGLWTFCLVITCISFVIIHSFSAVSLLKNQKRLKIPYSAAIFMKTVTLLVFAFLLGTIVQLVSACVYEVQQHQAYAKAQDMLTIGQFEYVGDEFSQRLNGNDVLEQKLDVFFEEAQKSADAGYFAAYDYDLDYFTSIQADPSGYDKPLVLVELNQNELVRYENWLSKPAGFYFEQDGITIIVPGCFTQAQRELAAAAVRYPYTVENKDVDIHIETYPYTGKPFFTQDQMLTLRGLAFTDLPVFVCLQGTYLNEHLSLSNSALSNPLRIPNTPQNLAAAKTALDNAGLANNHVVLEPLKDLAAKSAQSSLKTYSSMAFGSVVFLVFCDITATWYLILILLQMRKKEIFVKKLMGHSLFARYTREILTLTAMWGLSTCALFFMKPDGMQRMYFAGLMVLDFILWLLLIRNQEKASVQGILKGEM